MPWFILIFIELSRSLHYKFQHSPLIVMKTGMLHALTAGMAAAECGRGSVTRRPGLLSDAAAAARGAASRPWERRRGRWPDARTAEQSSGAARSAAVRQAMVAAARAAA